MKKNVTYKLILYAIGCVICLSIPPFSGIYIQNFLESIDFPLWTDIMLLIMTASMPLLVYFSYKICKIVFYYSDDHTNLQLAFCSLALELILIFVPYVYKQNKYIKRSNITTYGVISYNGKAGGSRATVRYLDYIYKPLNGTKVESGSYFFPPSGIHVGDTILVQYSTEKPDISIVYNFKPNKEKIHKYINDNKDDLLQEYNKGGDGDSTSLLPFFLTSIFIISFIGIKYNRRLEKQYIQKYGDNSAYSLKIKEEQRKQKEKEKEEKTKREIKKYELNKKFNRGFFDNRDELRHSIYARAMVKTDFNTNKTTMKFIKQIKQVSLSFYRQETNLNIQVESNELIKMSSILDIQSVKPTLRFICDDCNSEQQLQIPQYGVFIATDDIEFSDKSIISDIIKCTNFTTSEKENNIITLLEYKNSKGELCSVVPNMCYYKCPRCGSEYILFYRIVYSDNWMSIIVNSLWLVNVEKAILNKYFTDKKIVNFIEQVPKCEVSYLDDDNRTQTIPINYNVMTRLRFVWNIDELDIHYKYICSCGKLHDIQLNKVLINKKNDIGLCARYINNRKFLLEFAQKLNASIYEDEIIFCCDYSIKKDNITCTPYIIFDKCPHCGSKYLVLYNIIGGGQGYEPVSTMIMGIYKIEISDDFINKYFSAF